MRAEHPSFDGFAVWHQRVESKAPTAAEAHPEPGTANTTREGIYTGTQSQVQLSKRNTRIANTSMDGGTTRLPDAFGQCGRACARTGVACALCLFLPALARSCCRRQTAVAGRGREVRHAWRVSSSCWRSPRAGDGEVGVCIPAHGRRSASFPAMSGPLSFLRLYPTRIPIRHAELPVDSRHVYLPSISFSRISFGAGGSA
ncbi:hypothetical protein B0H10DRAFT_2059094, partial [Mycena sp. CBHHK59/15]